MGKKKVVLDTNIIISAFGWEGNPRKILRMILVREIELILSSHILAEVKRVLDYPKFKFNEQQKRDILSIVLRIAKLVEPKVNYDIIKEDATDNKFIDCAIEAKAEFIITGDAHLLKIKEHKCIRILTPREFLELQKE